MGHICDIQKERNVLKENIRNLEAQLANLQSNHAEQHNKLVNALVSESNLKKKLEDFENRRDYWMNQWRLANNSLHDALCDIGKLKSRITALEKEADIQKVVRVELETIRRDRDYWKNLANDKYAHCFGEEGGKF